MSSSQTQSVTSAPSTEASIELPDDSSAAQEILEVESQVRDITIIPPCILNCIYPKVLQNGCAHTNYVCFCYEMSPTLVDPEVQICLKQCSFLGEQLVAQGSIMDFCAVDEVDIVFPLFMSQYGIHHRRGFSSGIVSASSVETLPQTTPYTTITSTLPWGYSAYYYTQPEGDDGTATVVYAAADTSISTTYFITTTVPSGQAEYTSTFTDKKSAAITEVIAVTSGGTPKPTSSSPSPTTPINPATTPNSPASSQTQTQTPTSSGLSAGAKIGIGVAVPLVFIFLALALLLLFRKRRKQAPEQQESGDGGLPEPMSTISELKANPSSSQAGQKDESHVEALGVPIHEMNAPAEGPRYEADGYPPYPAGNELDAYPANQRYETDGIPGFATQNELSADPARRKPLPSQTAPAVPEERTTAFPPPWNSTGSAEYEYPQIAGPALGNMIEDPEIAQLEEEAARMKKKRERLQEMQELEEKEEAIRRSILERKKAAGERS